MPLNVNDIDPDTGFPKLPEKYFWRVTQTCSLRDRYYVEIRKRHLWGFSSLVIQSMAGTSKRGVLAGSYRCVDEWNSIIRQDTSLLGDYPPKKL